AHALQHPRAHRSAHGCGVERRLLLVASRTHYRTSHGGAIIARRDPPEPRPHRPADLVGTSTAKRGTGRRLRASARRRPGGALRIPAWPLSTAPVSIVDPTIIGEIHLTVDLLWI